MPNVKLLKQLPWLILASLLVTGAFLWLWFVSEQKTRVQTSFENQLERLADELMRSRLEGRLPETGLPEDVVGFALYDPQGRRFAEWGQGNPETIERIDDLWNSPLIRGNLRNGSWIGLVKILQPLGPRAGFGEPNPMMPDMRMRTPPPKRLQGLAFVSVNAKILDEKLVVWTVAAVVGLFVWVGFVGFVGALWFRTRSYQHALAQNRELLQFAEASRTLGHELQTPLAAILLQTALLRRSSGDEVPSEVTIIEEEARRMSGLISRVRDFLKDPRGPVQVLDLCDQVESLRDRFAVPVQVTKVGDFNALVRFEPYRLRSVLENLIKNAVESGPEPRPSIRISKLKPGWIRVEVIDNGLGFSHDALRKARDPFFTTKPSGNGVGLAITDNFVRAAGGKLRLENLPEGGARVTLELPEAHGDQA